MERFMKELELEHPMILGTWAWGDSSTWGGGGSGYDKSNDEANNRAAFNAAVDGGLQMFDTAEIYAMGKSEEYLGRFLKERLAQAGTSNRKLLVATKFIPLPYTLLQSSCRRSLTSSLARLQLPSADLYQIHGPAFSLRKVEVWAEALADVSGAGLARHVGVSNYNSDQMMRTIKVLEARGVRLLSNQIEYSLLHRLPEQTGLLEKCRQNGVAVLAYSPLAMGRLTGKYSATNLPQGKRRFGDCDTDTMLRVNDKLREIGERRGKTNAQVALNWCIQKGTIPIAGAKNAKQAAENAGALGWQLSAEEVQELDAVSIPGQTNLWQGSTN